MLQMQVHRVIKKIKREVFLCPKAATASLLLALVTPTTVARLALRTIIPNLVTAPVIPVAVGGTNAGILPSSKSKVRKKLHQAAN
jgi:hypothetical protein